MKIQTFKEFVNERGIGWLELDYKPRDLQIDLQEGYHKLYPLDKATTFTLEEVLLIQEELNSCTNEDEFLTDRQQLAYITHKLGIL